MEAEGLLSAEDLRAAVIELLFARCGHAQVEGPSKATQRNTPLKTSCERLLQYPPGLGGVAPWDAPSYIDEGVFWDVFSLVECYSDLFKFQDMPPPTPRAPQRCNVGASRPTIVLVHFPLAPLFKLLEQCSSLGIVPLSVETVRDTPTSSL
jgi:hypothetical protein